MLQLSLDWENKSKWCMGNKTNRQASSWIRWGVLRGHSHALSPRLHTTHQPQACGQLLQDPLAGAMRETPGFLPKASLSRGKSRGLGMEPEVLSAPLPRSTPTTHTHTHTFHSACASIWAESCLGCIEMTCTPSTFSVELRALNSSEKNGVEQCLET
jgi:hypothetical protein